jgi:DNA-binding NarL/FixJ family response regulator
MSSILLIQSEPAASARFCEILGTDDTLAVSGAVDTLARARAAIARRVPDLLIADLRLFDGPIVNLLDDLRPDRSHVLVLAPSLRDPYLMHALRHGADAYLIDGRPPETLLALVHQVLAGESPMAPEIARRVLENFDALNTRPIAVGTRSRMNLTEAQQSMLQWIGEGFLTPEIARGLDVTPQQVGLLIRSVYRRIQLDLRGRLEASPA